MKKLFLIAGVVSLIACVLALVFSALNWFGYYHLLDGSAEQYVRLHQRMIVGFVVGIVFAVIGIVCLILRAKS